MPRINKAPLPGPLSLVALSFGGPTIAAAPKPVERIAEPTKICTGCHQDKPITEYYPSRHGGAKQPCKVCARVYAAAQKRKRRA